MATTRPLLLDASVVPNPVHALVKLTFGQLDFLFRTLGVEQSVAHRDGDLIHVPNLREELFGDTAETQECPFLRESATVPHAELLCRNPAREVENLIATTARQRTTIGHAGLFPTFFGKPQPADVFDSVERDPARYGVASTRTLDRGDDWRRLGWGHKRQLIRGLGLWQESGVA
jgi:hypothetical protein